ncbi:MAG: glycoside hydrolase family 5 protein [Planctomycetes bacterium]|nr:glycoside hydrolase family 5 protein [Planctomycetota bacterium]
MTRCVAATALLLAAAVAAAEESAGAPALKGPLHTRGASIFDTDDNSVRLGGVNWYGMEGEDFVPGGLHRVALPVLLERVRALGFNHIRLPLSVELVLKNPKISDHVEANPRLKGLTALQILDEIVAAAGRAGVGILLDGHRLSAGWGDVGEADGLWESAVWPEEKWIEAWLVLARRYRGKAAVIGADLKNEPHGSVTWGSGAAGTDWRLAAERCGNAILKVAPEWLIFVEGTAVALEGEGHHNYWWGGNLTGVKAAPVRLNVKGRLVYSPHEYGPGLGKPPWFRDEESMHRVWKKAWGYLLEEGQAWSTPVYLGEFGSSNGLRPGEPPSECLEDKGEFSQGRWLRSLFTYLEASGASWSWWPLNGTMSDAAPAGRKFGELEFYGVLAPDWEKPASDVLMELFRRIQAR